MKILEKMEKTGKMKKMMKKKKRAASINYTRNLICMGWTLSKMRMF
jgi:hypothetical protein